MGQSHELTTLLEHIFVQRVISEIRPLKGVISHVSSETEKKGRVHLLSSPLLSGM